MLRTVLEDVLDPRCYSILPLRIPKSLRNQYVDGKFFLYKHNWVKLFHLTNHCSVRPPNSPGKSSYINNIPLPKFEMIEGFLYASIPSVLAYHVLGMGLPILDLQGETFNQYPETKLSSSARTKRLLDTATRNNKSYDIISFITEWSDSFDPNTSSKNNRASVYVKSITFVPASNSAFPSSFYTFPLCIGHGKTIKLELEKEWFWIWKPLRRISL